MRFLSLISISLLLLSHSAYSGEGAPPKENDPVWLVEARSSIKIGKYDQAIQYLLAANQTNSADWNNLLGYSLRNKQPADLLGAEKYYEAALKINPVHRGALEYYGILKLINNDLPEAEALLMRLDKACFFGCEEYSDLKDAIKKYKTKK
jgi:tetratricopeptide (TPR) repeat protein